ncbi:hypothetical protein N2601_31280 (plasmid) [Rhizobium sp. CB3060]|uniref:hypothetical protein n=1 Tax=Rhizobium sp. CB3060 TaxID=3138255 RepID=UPI0021A3A721|nr:hypothetical protein [Rhizobium tropici]UWU25468.1 hypothetical protein N2601_31280 [Rhizobium tropici]
MARRISEHIEDVVADEPYQQVDGNDILLANSRVRPQAGNNTSDTSDMSQKPETFHGIQADFEGFFWREPFPLAADEVHPKLLEEIGNRQVRMLQADLSYQSEEFYLGSLEMAFDDDSGKVCGIFRLNANGSDFVAGPAWLETNADVNDVIQTFADAIPVDEFFALMQGEDEPAHKVA